MKHFGFKLAAHPRPLQIALSLLLQSIKIPLQVSAAKANLGIQLIREA